MGDALVALAIPVWSYSTQAVFQKSASVDASLEDLAMSQEIKPKRTLVFIDKI